jgi:murein DD-endopeptidase MepM/ murein hydrolase activator NlpD
MQKLIFYTRRNSRTLRKRVQEALDIIHLAPSMEDVTIDIVTTKATPDVRNGRITEEWFQKNITSKQQGKYTGAYFHVSKAQGKSLGLNSSLRGSHFNDKDTFGEMWIQSDLNETIKFKDGTRRNKLAKVIAHEFAHHLKYTGVTSLDIHAYDHKSDINNIEQFYKDLGRPEGIHKVLPDQWFKRVTQPFLNPNSWYKTGYHMGTDFGCPIGTPVYAPVDGEIYTTRNLRMAGKTIYFLCTINGARVGMRFSHLSKALKNGNYQKGDIIGYTGNSGSLTTGPHLHWDCWKGWNITTLYSRLKNKATIEENMYDPLDFYKTGSIVPPKPTVDVIKPVEITLSGATKAQFLKELSKRLK